MKKKRLIYIFLGLFFLFLFISYVYLGGFNKPEIAIKNAEKVYVLGKSFKGKMASKEFGALFSQAEDLKKKLGSEGIVGGVFYDNPEKPADTITAFVGLVYKTPPSAVPDSVTVREVESRKVVEARIEAHYMVVPVNIYENIKDYAKKNKLELKEVPALELYPSNREIVIQVPVK